MSNLTDNFDLLQNQQPLISELSLCENWLVDDNSSCQPYFPEELDTSVEPYRLYRFLTDLDHILLSTTEDISILKAILPKVRQLLISAEWLHTSYVQPPSNPGWSVKTLYQEPNYPITIQTVAWLPGKPSPIHNHGGWGVVALISGREKNTFWRKSAHNQHPNRIEQVAEHILEPGDIIGFTPDAIHSVEALGNEPTVTLNIYGKPELSDRYEFDSVNHTATNF